MIEYSQAADAGSEIDTLMLRRNSLFSSHEGKLEEIEKINERLKELDDPDEDEYDDWLDELYGEVQIAGMKYATSNALKQVDETAYELGKNDFASSEIEDKNGELVDCVEELGEIREEIIDLTLEIVKVKNDGLVQKSTGHIL